MPRRVLQGVVTSDKATQTVVVRVERRYRHRLLKKTVRSSRKYHAHDEGEAFKEGEEVRIRECRPLSRLKRWEVLPRELKEEAPSAAKEEDDKSAAKGEDDTSAAKREDDTSVEKGEEDTKATKGKDKK